MRAGSNGLFLPSTMVQWEGERLKGRGIPFTFVVEVSVTNKDSAHRTKKNRHPTSNVNADDNDTVCL